MRGFPIIALGVCVLVTTGFAATFLSNLPAQCLRCLCEAATGCDRSLFCVEGYCGPFRMSKVYWVDGDKHVLPDDTPDRANAFEDCAINYDCASNIVVNYMNKYGRDCTGNEITTCDDYAVLHFLGGYNCDHNRLNSSDRGQQYLERYRRCNRDTLL